jgi:hypothetical protein
MGGSTSSGPLPQDPRGRWRSMFVDEIEDAVVVSECWQSAENFSIDCNCVDTVAVAVSA